MHRKHQEVACKDVAVGWRHT